MSSSTEEQRLEALSALRFGETSALEMYIYLAAESQNPGLQGDATLVKDITRQILAGQYHTTSGADGLGSQGKSLTQFPTKSAPGDTLPALDIPAEDIVYITYKALRTTQTKFEI